MRDYTKVTVIPGSEVEPYLGYATAYCEAEGDRVLREVWLRRTGEMWRLSIARNLNEEPGSLRSDAPQPGCGGQFFVTERSTAGEFEDFWSRAVWSPDSQEEPI